jgi:hypothetical protein
VTAAQGKARRVVRLAWLNPRQIALDLGQPRQRFPPDAQAALEGSIAQLGLLQPLGVALVGAGQYRLLWGERRWRAALALELDTVLCVVWMTPPTWQEALALQLADHATSLPLSPHERAAALWRLTLGAVVAACEEACGDDGAATAAGLAGAATPADQLAVLAERLCALRGVGTLAEAWLHGSWEAQVLTVREASGIGERAGVLRQTLTSLALPSVVEDGLVGIDRAGLLVQGLAQGSLAPACAAPLPWTDAQVRRLERALGEAQAICAEAQGQELSERQARRLQLRLLALLRALEETGGGRTPIADEEAVEEQED